MLAFKTSHAAEHNEVVLHCRDALGTWGIPIYLFEGFQTTQHTMLIVKLNEDYIILFT